MARNTALLGLAAWLLAGCAGTPGADSKTPVTDLYCTSYLVYSMCAHDLDSNGQVDLMYFEDSEEIFLLAEDFRDATFEQYTRHECVQPMDQSLRETSSQLLFIDDDAGMLTKTRLKSRLLMSYTRYVPRINRCMHGEDVADSHSAGSDEEAFGDRDFENW